MVVHSRQLLLWSSGAERCGEPGWPQDLENLEIREMSGKKIMSGKSWNCQGILKYVREILCGATSHYCTYHLTYLISHFQCTYSNVLT
jgi:hypothetical protein